LSPSLLLGRRVTSDLCPYIVSYFHFITPVFFKTTNA
jgi:hypothetical protein